MITNHKIDPKGTDDMFFLVPVIFLAILIFMFAILGNEDNATEAAPYQCPSGTELIRGEMTGWFCATRPTIKQDIK